MKTTIMTRITSLLVLFLIITTLSARAGIFQATPKSKIYGKITDAKTGEILFGVIVTVEGTSVGASSDFEGGYTLMGLAPGTYKIKFKLMSYKEKVVEVALKDGDAIDLNISLEDAATDLGTVEVTTTYKQESVSSLLIEQKKAVAISDGISADAIKRSPDNNTGEVMKRVSGASIQDGRFAVIRGLNDRYNSAFLNGAPLPSTESDRRAFAFDIFPSNMVDKLVITKTATPDLPADFAGGIINIVTRDIPEDPFLTLSTSWGYNAITTFRQRAYSNGGKWDWLGIDDGTRSLSSSLPSTADYKAATQPGDSSKLNWSKLFSNNWGTQRQASTMPNGSFQASMGTSISGAKNKFGVILALSYNNSSRFSLVDRKQNDLFDNNVALRSYQDSAFKREILGGALLNFGYKIGDNHKISLKNVYAINTEDQTILRHGLTNMNDSSAMQQVYNTAYWYQQNQLSSTQLVGEHYMPGAKIKIKWTGGYSHVSRKMPDFRRVSYARGYDPHNPDSVVGNYTAQIGNQVQLEQAGRFFSTLKENIYSAGYEIGLPFEFMNSKNFETNFKAGGYHQYRSRDFNARSFGYVFKPGSGLTNGYKQTALDSIFDPSNFIYKRFYIDEATNPTDSYTASSMLHAGFIMFDQRFMQNIRAVWGLRVENYNQKLSSLDSGGDPLEVNTTKLDWLPSVNLTYEVTKRMNLRFSASKTLSRPEFREIAPFAFYDFNLDAVVAGNPDLQRTSIANYDVRWEYYPTGGELVSATFFYKNFTNPIEFINEPNVGAGSRRFGYANAPGATNYGFELEVRKNFSFLDSLFNTKAFGNFVFFGNFAYIVSKVDVSSFGDASTGTRPLQGQSPYIINAGLQFNEPTTDIGFSLMVNRSGRRIAYVGNAQMPNIFENPRTVLDFQLSKRFFKKLDVKFTLGDILAQRLVFYQDLNNNKKFDGHGRGDNLIFSYTYGMNASLGLSYKF